MHSMQKKKATHLPTGSRSSAKKIETTSRSPTMKLFMKKEKIQPSKSSAGVASKSRTRRTLPSRLVTQRKDTTFDNQRQKHHICKDHIVWEGFDDCIVRLRRAVYHVMDGMAGTNSLAKRENCDGFDFQLNKTAKSEAKDFTGDTKEISSSKQALGMSRKDSFGELLLHLPRIASLPKFLFNISEDEERS
ncbi:hypothetical protein V6N11_026674 [Hibiscus sabdariffa]|uniref:Uncharacterized protein n=1 Tax=Hibiscus sabdariffa TaxID=183260 RepID=A0ABR2SWD5_9ROSI